MFFMKHSINTLLLTVGIVFLFSCAQDDQMDTDAAKTQDPKPREVVVETATAVADREDIKDVTPPKADDTEHSTVLARVGDEIITEEDVMGKLALVPEQFRDRFATPEAKEKLLEQTINTVVLINEARRLGIDKQPDVVQKVNEITNNIIIQELTRQVLQERVAVTEEEKKQYYNDNTENFFSPEKIDASLILFAVDEETAETDRAQKKQLAQDTIARLKTGADFAELARELSDDVQTARRGGKLGYFSKGKQELLHGTVFEETVFSLEPGEMSDVFEDSRGFYIVKMDDKRPEKQKTFEEAKNRIQQILMQDKQQSAFEDYLQALREKDTVTVYEDRL